MSTAKRRKNKYVAQSSTRELELHTLGWKAFQDLCSQICEEILKLPVSIYREAQDGGQDAVFLTKSTTEGSMKIGTIQCKFTSKSDKRLKLSDLTPELESIGRLVAEGMANHYYFITNMGIDAPVAQQIRNALASLGVSRPEVYGKEWLTLKIRESARLRALVPRIYGLGDLSIILDERKADQTQALLGHLKSELRSYVPTAAHRRAVKCLGEYGITLLLGAPATGKSMIAAVLATTALDDVEHLCYQLDGPNEITTHWNPNETGGFYWIDDAFGASQLRDDFVDTWIAIMGKVKTAIANGNRFVLTSRQHVWEAAKDKLGTKNHPGFSDGRAIVNVGDITVEERAQILYNHIKNGSQDSAWKTLVKPYLNDLARDQSFIPELARRLANPSYTENIKSFPQDLSDFVSNPKLFLLATINELDPKLQATLLLIFLNRSRLTHENISLPRTMKVAGELGIAKPEIFHSLSMLDGSFIRKKTENNKSFWTFAHPTIADALSQKLEGRTDLMEIYLGGARIETILSETYCEGAAVIIDAISIPEKFSQILYKRIAETPDEPMLNRALFNYLEIRTSDEDLEIILHIDQTLLSRTLDSNGWDICYDPKIRLYARANELGLLSEEHSRQVEHTLEHAITHELDSSFLEEQAILKLIAPIKLMQITSNLIENFEDDVSQHISTVVEFPDSAISALENFEEIISHVCNLKALFFDASTLQDKIKIIERKIYDGIAKIESRVNQNYSDWAGVDTSPAIISAASNSRSVFSDLDE